MADKNLRDSDGAAGPVAAAKRGSLSSGLVGNSLACFSYTEYVHSSWDNMNFILSYAVPYGVGVLVHVPRCDGKRRGVCYCVLLLFDTNVRFDGGDGSAEKLGGNTSRASLQLRLEFAL